MGRSTKHDFSSSNSLQANVIVQSPKVNQLTDNESKEKRGYYADNLAFEHDELITRSASDVYHQLSESTENLQNGSISISRPSTGRPLFCRAVISGCLLAFSIVMFYLWVHVRYINPMISEIMEASSVQVSSSSSLSRASLMSKINTFSNIQISMSTWLVDYDLPDGVPVLKLSAKEIWKKPDITCPPQKFALALYVQSDSYLAEDWLKDCGHNIAYFRVDGDPSADDIDRLVIYLNNANYLPLKGSLNIEKGGNIRDNEDFQKTKKSDEIIRNVVISGYVTPQTIEELVEAVPYAEELTIEGDAICSSLKRSRQSSKEGCQLSWHVLQKLHIIETGSCLGMFDLIYSCWDMPSIETLQVRKSNINDPNANYIKGILDKYRITRVDFADNVCFGNTLEDYPFMCQPSN